MTEVLFGKGGITQRHLSIQNALDTCAGLGRCYFNNNNNNNNDNNWRTNLTIDTVRFAVGRPQTSSSPPVIFIAGRPKAALLFWFFGDFRCGALLFMVIHVIYKYKNR